MDDVALVVSELATNAVLHGSGDIELRIAFDGRTVTGSFADAGGGFAPPPREPRHTPGGGNELYLVDRLTSRWGVRVGRSNVWFEIRSRAVPQPAG